MRLIVLIICAVATCAEVDVSWQAQRRNVGVYEDIILWMSSSIRTLVVVSTLETHHPEFLKNLHRILATRTSSCAIVTARLTPNLTCQLPKIKRGPWKGIFEVEQAFILITSTYKEIICYFEEVRQGTGVMPLLRNPSANTLVFTVEPERTDQAQNALKTLWERHRMINVAIIPLGSSKVCTYNPFQYWEEGGRLEVNEARELSRVWRRRLLYLNRYPVRVVMFHRWPTALQIKGKWSGVDGIFLTTLAKAMGFTLIVVKPMQVREYVGALEALVNGDADMALNGRFLEQQDGDVSLTRPAYSDRLCAAVRRAPRLPQWKTLLRIFSLRMHILLLVLNILVTCMWYLLQRRNAFLTTLQIFIGHSLHPVPLTWSQRTLLISCLFSSVVIVAAYQGQLVTMLSRTDYLPDIDTLSELAHSGVDIATGAVTILNNTFTDDGPEAQLLRAHLRLLIRNESLLEYLEHSEEAERLAVLTRESRALEYVAKPGSRLHVVAECVRYYHLAYLTPQGSPLLRRIDIIISRLVEGGLFARWSKAPVGIEDYIPSEKVFTFEDLFVAFLILGVGLIISLLVFVTELYRELKNWQVRRLRRILC